MAEDSVDIVISWPRELSILLSVVTGLTGLFLVLDGWNNFRWAVLSLALMFGASLGYFVGMVTGGSAQTATFCAGSGAALVGWFTIKVVNVGVFVTGASLGTILWMPLRFALGNRITQGTAYLFLTLITIIMGSLALALKQQWVKLASPTLGAFLIIVAMDYWVDGDPNILELLVSTSGCETVTCNVLYSSVAVIATLSFVYQYQKDIGAISPISRMCLTAPSEGFFYSRRRAISETQPVNGQKDRARATPNVVNSPPSVQISDFKPLRSVRRPPGGALVAGLDPEDAQPEGKVDM